MNPSGLPIDEALPALREALAARSNAVLVAPPGAGKTTVVPLALLQETWCEGRVIVLEPRRVAARAAAARMARTLDERVGDTVGLRVRLQTSVGPRTRVEVVTEGVFTRLLLADPELGGVSAVLLDEFHERSLDADLALALLLDAQALRPDLRVLVMSATLDGARVAALMDAAVVEARGRAFPVTIEHRPRPAGERIEDAVARAVLAERGSVLAFLPGRREIERTAERLQGTGLDVRPLHGGLTPGEQDRAIRPVAPGERRAVLATSIAETSLTIDGMTAVIDSGLARRPRFDPATGVTRLETVRVSQAAATQRAGRAGRTAPGRCVRLWREEQWSALPPFDPPEILHADLAPLALDLLDWGVRDPAALVWLDPPPLPAWTEALRLLERLDAVRNGALTEHGRRLARRPLPPRLAHAVERARDPVQAAEIALLTQERGLGGADVDLAVRLDAFGRDRTPRAKALRALARRTAEGLERQGETESVGTVLARAFPDRVAQRTAVRDGVQRFRLANGVGAGLDSAHPLARAPFLVVADLAGAAGGARITQAAAIDRDGIEAVLPLRRERTAEWDGTAVRARERTVLDALVLHERPVAPTEEERTAATLDALRRDGLQALPWPDDLRPRLLALGHDVSDAALQADLDGWLAPFLSTGPLDERLLADALLLRAGLDRHALDRAAPPRLTLPAGRAAPVRWTMDGPEVEARPQELFGLDRHPEVAGRPVRLVLVSPAGRPIQTTLDLPGFWRGTWVDVRRDMRGRYPKHPWPEDPVAAQPTTRTKRRV